MILLLLATVSAAQPAEAPSVRPAPPATRAFSIPREALCDWRMTRTQAVPRGPAAPRKLGELPPGYMILAVDKHVNGCPVNVLPARDEIGNHRMEWAPLSRKVPTPTGR